MSTLAEVKAVIPQLSATELATLEQIVQVARREKSTTSKPSLQNLRPASVGKILRPLGTREEWHDEMREGRA